jgi:hypothetical protein
MVFIPLGLLAYTASSSNYLLNSDSINSGGNSYSTSTTYQIGDTVGEIGTGTSSSATYSLSAGFWTTGSSSWISLSSSGNVSLGALNGLLGGTATGSAAYVVTTNNTAGYQLIVQALTSPALRSPQSSIPDYSPGTSNPDFTFTISSSTDARFGFSPEGTDIVQRYKDNGSSCNVGSSDTADACWDGFATTTQAVAQSASANDPNGATTTIQYEVKLGAGRLQPSSASYSANVIITALTL